MTNPRIQRSAELVADMRTHTVCSIDELMCFLDKTSAEIEAAFCREQYYLDDLYSDRASVSEVEIDQVQLFDKGYAKTMACIQAAAERLIEARAHLSRTYTTVVSHPELLAADRKEVVYE